MNKPIEVLESTIDYDCYELDGEKLCDVCFTVTIDDMIKMHSVSNFEDFEPCEYIKLVRDR